MIIEPFSVYECAGIMILLSFSVLVPAGPLLHAAAKQQDIPAIKTVQSK